MKRFCLTFSLVFVLAAGIMGTAASGAFAYTEGQAREAAYNYAHGHWGGEPYVWDCPASGKNKAGEAQYYCYGYFNQRGGEWKVNVGPYGEITYARE